MPVDLIMQARHRRGQLAAELARLTRSLRWPPSSPATSSIRQPVGPLYHVAAVQPAARGVSADTVLAALEIVQGHGPQATTGDLPAFDCRARHPGRREIPEIATLSARLSTTGKGMIRMSEGQMARG